MRFNEDILCQLTWEEVIQEQVAQRETPVDKMKKYLNNKYPKLDFFHYLWLSDLYKVEANIEFSEIQLKRFRRTEKFGHPKTCPLYKFIYQPTLF